PLAPVGASFHLDHLKLVRQVFPGAERHVRSDPPADGSHRPRLLALINEQVEAITGGEGVLRVAKVSGCFVATV
ncbi:MAG: hypothetical protein JO057_05425, partial [Chloroflexi bacterium]|nr:hypothetical protein [Chloroflexota bacterium]